jgi:mannose-1-phosphate guanylyltransferase
MRIVIRAGGVGTRLWPMSRQNNPKQFQPVVTDQSMVRATFERIKDLASVPEQIFVSVNQQMQEHIKAELPEIKIDNLIVETDTRNTGPAICLEVCYLEKFCKPKEVIASLTSDDYISDAKAFRELLLASENFLQQQPNHLLALSVAPSCPDTGYTYFKLGDKLHESENHAIYRVAKVQEKPNEDLCKELLASGEYYCHAGMYVWQLGYIAALFAKLQPQMYQTCKQIVDLMLADKIANLEKITELYCGLEKMTIESAITDKADNLVMSVSNRFGWSDLGKWHIIKRILSDEGENLIRGEVIAHEANNNLVYNNNKGRIIALNDVRDLIIVDTGDVLLISSNKNSADVKEIVAKLKEQGKQQYL